MRVLQLVPIYCTASRDLLVPLAERLSEVFRLRVEEHPPSFDPEGAFDPSRGQYNSRILLAHLIEQEPRGAERILGVTEVDLFIPVLTFVFGEAQLDGRAAVVSSYRLQNEVYGLPPDRPLMADRLCKEAIHELGHTYNLVHCHGARCVMASATQLDAVDQKLCRFCERCLDGIRGQRR